MKRFQLEPRDYEILRALSRLRFLTSAEINGTFFSSVQAGYRRIKILGHLNLLKRHTLGVPPRASYCAWRLTSAGIAAVQKGLPREVVPEGLEDRLQRQSLFNMDHREAVSRLYLELVRGGADERIDGASCEAVRRWTAQVRARADQFEWQPDGDVVLQFRELADEHRIVPDATITSAKRSLRIFLELDRSSKTLARIEENLRSYAAFLKATYSKTYPDRKRPWLVYVVQTELRGTNIARLGERVLGTAFSWKVLVLDRDATAWLAATLLDEHRQEGAGDPPPGTAKSTPVPSPLRAATHDFLCVTNVLLKDASAVFDELSDLQPELMGKWKRALGALYLCAKEQRRG